MENQLQTFTNEKFGDVRMLIIDGEPWFVGKDVAEILSYKNTADALYKHVDEEDKGVAKCDTLGGTQNMTIINESGLYSLILRSRLPEAKSFKHWVTSEILPSVRKHGAYMTPEKIKEVLYNPDTIIKLATDLKSEQEKNRTLSIENAKQKEEIDILQPKAAYHDLVLSTKNAICISIIAKDYGWSPQRLNNYPQKKRVQYNRGGTWLLYQEHCDKGYTNSVTVTWKTWCGEEESMVHTKWTQKGRLFIYELLKEDGILPIIEKQKTLQRQKDKLG